MPFARTAPLRRELALALPDAAVRGPLLGRHRVPATAPDGPTFEIHSPEALAHALRAPGELGLGRAYVLGLIDVDDIEKALRIVDTFEPPKLVPGPDRPARRRARAGRSG